MGNTLWCWGDGTFGELGTGHTTSANLPQQVTKRTAGWNSITVGGFHTCATRSDGTLWCWGYNDFGQLGIGNTISQDLPQQVTSPAADGWASGTAGYQHTCAARSDTTLWCWGNDREGELGIGNSIGQYEVPQQVTVPAGTGWTSPVSGGFHTCATRTHALWCWGQNDSGQLGIGSTAGEDLPQRVRVPTSTGWSLIALGTFHTCATHTGHTLWCWGNNFQGQLGIGSTANQDLPQQVTS